ncbi:PREDICTED: putative leucine-rich repeat-containing protein DDB_G0290503 isoform X2 [Lupinus angustifolius]|uniref:putative leucine-rich repeat-containing protein DDB_G0290503 isoform X2 n=1 Tax=Lupinus angustifolius TaxID=3871 RepID=UPI00092F954D|nr:PREDICTED: putative leucine-rich repeat-containing protein DDB_G0290503 isoform X2 [Lupinus angustifolius]
MSRVTKWKVEKTKVKVVFRLQFLATHIPQSGWDKLFISFIPVDTGKATAKTTKASVRNGTCKWSDPIYETTRLLQDIKTRQYEEKLYKLVVGMGSSRSSILGEANINLADFVDALKPTAITFPLNGSESGTTLHVTVQLLTSKTGFREFEQQRELREKGLQTFSDQGTRDESPGSKESSPDHNVNRHINKVNSKTKLKRETKDLPCASSLGESGTNEEYTDSAAGFDGSSSTSGSVYTEKHDISSIHEVGSLKSTMSGDLGVSLGQSPQPEKGDTPDNQFSSQGSDWVHGWSIDKGNLEAVESSIFDLKLEVSSLQNHADEIGVETQKISEKLVTEIMSGEELAKEVTVIKAECSKFKDEFEQLKSSKLSLAHTTREPTETDRDKLFQKLLPKWLKGLLLMEDKLRDIKKVSIGFPERDFRFLNLELEALVGIVQDLKQESGGLISGANVTNGIESKKMDFHIGEQFLTDIGSGAALFQSEGMAHYFPIPGLASHESDLVDPALAMKGKVFELLRELDESKTERESLVRKMDQMECYYEALIQELEQSQRQMMVELQNLRNEHSTCVYTISAGKTEMERMHQSMNEQAMNFSEDKRILESLSSEFERRAISAEAALKRARLNYSIAVGQLQKDLEVLSCQIVSMHETNENLLKETFSDCSLPNGDGRQPMKYPKTSEAHTSNRLLCQNQSSSLHRQHLGEDIFLSDLKRSLQLQEGLYKQVEEEICEMYFVNIYSDVFSKALQETLIEASLDIQLMKEEVVRLSQQLKLTNESNELLVLRLQNAMNDILSLNEYNEICTAKSNEVSHQNQILEASLKDLVHENNLITQKNNELEIVLTNYRSCEGKYIACSEENLELKSLLEKESLENGYLHNEISILKEELKGLRIKFDELTPLKDNLDNKVSFLSAKLQKLLASYGDSCSELSLCSRSACLDSECGDVDGLLLQLEERQKSVFDKILLLTDEKKVLVNEKHMAQVSLHTAESDVLVMKKKFEHDLHGVLSNVSVSGSLLQKLQLDFEVIVDRINAGFEGEEIYFQHHKEFLSGFDHLEAEVQQLNSRNQEIAQEIGKLDTLYSDLEMCNLTLAAVTEQKKVKELSLQEKTAESAKISSELNVLKESLNSLYNELHAERIVREKLEKTVTDLTTELNEKQCQLQDSDMNRHQVHSRNQELAEEVTKLDTLSNDLKMCKLNLMAITEEKKALELSLQEKTEESSQILAELSFLKESLHSRNNDLHDERTIREELEKTITDLTTELNEKQCQLQDSDMNRQEVNSRNQDLAQEIMKLDTLSSELASCKLTLEATIEEKKSLEMSLQDKTDDSAKISSELNFLKENLLSLHSELHAERTSREKLEKTVIDLTTELSEKQCQLQESDTNRQELVSLKQLVTDLEFEKSRMSYLLQKSEERLEHALRESSSIDCLETYFSELHEFSIATDVLMTSTRAQYEGHVEELHKKSFYIESQLNDCVCRESTYIAENTRLLTSLDNLKSDLETSTSQCRALIDQNRAIISELNEHKSRTESVNDVRAREGQCVREVTRLEQVLASLFLAKEESELKCIVLQAKLDELEVAITSLKQSDGELLRLQNQCNDLTKRLSEQALKTEEFKNLSIHLKEQKDKAEAECLNARDRRGHEGPPVAMQESLRIAFIKEQYETKLQELKQQLALSKKYSEEMLWKLQAETEETENRKKSEAAQIKINEELGMKILEMEAELQAVISDKRNLSNAYDLIKAEKECSVITLECCKQEKQELEASLLKCNEEKSKIEVALTMEKELNESLRSHASVPIEVNDTSSSSLNSTEKSSHSTCNQEPENTNLLTNVQSEDPLASRAINGCQTLGAEEDLQQKEKNYVALTESLKSSIDHLNKELERMKNDNLLPKVDEYSHEPSFPGLQRELVQLHEANKEIGNIFPVFNETSFSGNALERVLALEVELAQALQAKKNSSLQFHSSFLKQYSDEEAVFRSFRDINELIKDMLELKARHSAVETELKEMHDRYSQLSLQFAEVEGERQKLHMTLKNTRTSFKKTPNSSSFFRDHSYSQS